ncbi:hypothetical protein KBB96_02330 [Luteolibacter ambystomatis]|uniref:Uncharacterized protein n=1 Tax=Luteolibacter ambystomatis TaxID=2824561 RepID=A0A975J0F9_9BACT|nr:thrombospondin type 3 repeat-containing protein [Luteolibacter ambystomatis]QUE51735.1 hypothetical protein KBB96_02330 [Luteolibacter ambystomatis]
MRAHLYRSALFVLASSVLAVTSAQAVNPAVPDPVTGDVFLAFRASDGQGSATSYLVKLGVDTQFTTAAAGSSFDVSGLGNIGEDLKATYGDGWNTRADLFWGIFSFRPNNGNPIIYGSRERTQVNVRSTAWPTLVQQSRSSTSNQISAVIQNIGGYKGRLSTDNSLIATFQTNSADASSYNKQVATAGTSDFGSLSQWSSIEGSFGNGEAGTILDFHRIAASGVTTVGSFSISASGTIHFTNVVPTNPNTDTDHDGVTDANEAIAGTNPNDSTDFFRLQSVAPAGDGIHVNFNVVASRTYTVEYSQTLAAGSWESIGTYAATGAAPHTFLDTDAVRRSRPTGFYRVRVSQ